jgi:hypothetical protein
VRIGNNLNQVIVLPAVEECRQNTVWPKRSENRVNEVGSPLKNVVSMSLSTMAQVNDLACVNRGHERGRQYKPPVDE